VILTASESRTRGFGADGGVRPTAFRRQDNRE
jgi:hypothetical protein